MTQLRERLQKLASNRNDVEIYAMTNPTKLLLLAIAIGLLAMLLVAAIQDKELDTVWREKVLEKDGYEIVRF